MKMLLKPRNDDDTSNDICNRFLKKVKFIFYVNKFLLYGSLVILNFEFATLVLT